MEKKVIYHQYNGEVISFNIFKLPNLEQINGKLNKVFNNNKKYEGLILRSD